MGDNLFSQIASIFFIIETIVILCLGFATLSYDYLYEAKNKPKYPITPESQMKSFAEGSIFTKKFFITPFFMWKIMFERHKDKELKSSANRVRILLFLFFAVAIIQFITFITLFEIGIL